MLVAEAVVAKLAAKKAASKAKRQLSGVSQLGTMLLSLRLSARWQQPRGSGSSA